MSDRNEPPFDSRQYEVFADDGMDVFVAHSCGWERQVGRTLADILATAQAHHNEAHRAE